LLALPRVKLISRFYLGDESGPCGCRRAIPRAQGVCDFNACRPNSFRPGMLRPIYGWCASGGRCKRIASA